MNRRERETCLNLSAEDRVNGGTWQIYSDDPAMITRLRRVVKPHKQSGAGYFFRLPAASVSFRKPRHADESNYSKPLQGDDETR